MTGTSSKSVGFVATPGPIAEELVRWAIRDRSDVVLDIGAGEGVFLVAAGRRLLEMGASKDDLPASLHGVEKDGMRFAQAKRRVEEELGVSAPGVQHADLFHSEFPRVSAIVGNPPYVRRASLDDIDVIQTRILHNDLFVGDIPRLTDLYIYFLLYAEQFLVGGGRLAVVVSSSWLDTRSGEFFKKFLLSRFRLHAIVSCEARLFHNALVKSVLLLAEKNRPSSSDFVQFARLGAFSSGVLPRIHEGKPTIEDDLRLECVKQSDLQATSPWSIYLRTPRSYSIASSRMSTTLGAVADSRIGIQPLAKDFFVLTTTRATAEGLPEDQLMPLAYSPRSVARAIVVDASGVGHRILSTRQATTEMVKPLRDYIQRAECREVAIRGKDRTVKGYQNVERLQQAGRQPWYNLRDEIERRGQYSILLPRRFYESFVVPWNKAGVVAGENFIEVEPKDSADVLPLLAVLNSSFFEVVARSHAQQYGGGVFNLNPVDVRRLPIPALSGSTSDRESLASAFVQFADDPLSHGHRKALDEVVAAVFGYEKADLQVVWLGMAELRALGSSSKHGSAPPASD